MSIGSAWAPTEIFERERPRLVGLAYRMLGTVSDAEDVVQDAWLRWRTVGPGDVDRPEAWLTTVTTRIALDHLRTARRRRQAYVGPWLPEPLVAEPGPAEAAEMAESLRLGFLTVLDQLTPVERAVFLLADVFAVPFADIAASVGKSEPACRQIASRARRRVRRPGGPRHAEADRAVVDALMLAVATGDTAAALRHLAPDVVCVSDGGAATRAARRPVVGAERVARLLVNLTRRHAGRLAARPAEVNGDVGSVVLLDGTVDMVTAFEVDGGRVITIRMVRNPDKLGHVDHPPTVR
ncbi:MAG: RNA polymerase sigma factor SigJ [Acidimicrobiales bacterium]|jgi:RNA polymerase sigma-70 factor (ECF subfamily)